MGHFMRCRTLALELVKRKWVVFFVGSGMAKELSGNGKRRVNQIINLVEFGPFKTAADDSRALLDILTREFDLRVDCLVIDTYFYNREDYAFLQRFGRQKLPIMVIDDLASRDTPAQAVLNPNPLFSREPYERQKIPSIMCGEEYTLIRPEVAALRDRPYSDEGLIMITLGGGDVVEPMMRVLSVVPDGLANRICVSVSANCPVDAINDWISRDATRRFLNTDSDRFPELLASSAFAITGGGTTLWETYCLGVPNLCLVWVDNQRQTSVVIRQQATSFLVDFAEQINQGLQSELFGRGIGLLKSGVEPDSEVRRRELQNQSASDVIRRENTSFLVDNQAGAGNEFISGILREFRNMPEQWQEMMRRQRALIDGAGAVRCADLLDNLTWQQVDLLPSDWRKDFENWSA
jgi:spore coat polysaccharide biosynthesis predicted glycosyltransferase SpsG